MFRVARLGRGDVGGPAAWKKRNRVEAGDLRVTVELRPVAPRVERVDPVPRVLVVAAGNVRDKSFGEIWTNSTLFRELRDLSNIKGKCSICEYKMICGGCRARAYESTGDYLEAEPYCIYEPAI